MTLQGKWTRIHATSGHVLAFKSKSGCLLIENSTEFTTRQFWKMEDETLINRDWQAGSNWTYGGERWRREEAGSWSFLVEEESGEVLEVEGGSQTEGAKVILGKRHGQDSQRWTFDEVRMTHESTMRYLQICQKSFTNCSDCFQDNTMNGRTLYYAVDDYRGNVDDVRRLANDDKTTDKTAVNWNNGDDWGWTPLHKAANDGFNEVAQVLLDAGAEVDKEGFRAGRKTGGIPLHKAAANFHRDATEVLLKAGAEVDKGVQTPLFKVIERFYRKPEYLQEVAEVVKLLILWGADPRKADNNGKSPLSEAKNNHADSSILAMLKDGGAKVFIDHFSNGGECAPAVLANAARTKRHQIVELILGNTKPELLRQALIHKDRSGKNALEWAVENKCTTTAELILQKGCNDTAVLGPGIIASARTKQHHMVVLILENTMEDYVYDVISYTDSCNKNALEWAVETQLDTSTAEIILQLGYSDATLLGPGLNAAVATGNLKMVALLLKHTREEHLKETLLFRDQYGMLTLDCAVVKCPDAFKLILQLQKGFKDFDIGSCLEKAIRNKKHESIVMILDHIKDESAQVLESLPHEVEVFGSVIAMAARENKNAVVVLLLENMEKAWEKLLFRPLIYKLQGKTALEWAEESRCEPTVKTILMKLGSFVRTAVKEKKHIDFITILQNIENADHLHEVLLYGGKESKTALRLAVDADDKYVFTEILRREHLFFSGSGRKQDGLRCIKEQLSNDKNLKPIIEQFGDFYNDKTICAKRLAGCLAILSTSLSFGLYTYDTASDIVLSTEYHNCSDPCNHNQSNYNATSHSNGNYLSNTCYDEYGRNVSDSSCSYEPNEYMIAFVTNVLPITISLLTSFVVIIFSDGFWDLRREMVNHISGNSKTLARVTLMTYILVLCPPLFIMIILLYFKYQYNSSASTKRKIDYVKQLGSSEYYWGLLSMIEAGLESSIQLILQVWLVSRMFKINGFYNQIPDIAGIIRGILFLFLPTASPIEISIGKILVSLVSVVNSIGGCYRFEKREAISLVETMPIFAMLFSSVLGRVTAFAAFFSTEAPFEIWMPIFYILHTSFVLAIKMRHRFGFGHEQNTTGEVWGSGEAAAVGTNDNEPRWYQNKKLKDFLIDLLGAASSFLVLVNIKTKDQRSRSGGTFYLHLSYFILILIENVLLASSPLMVGNYRGNPNPTHPELAIANALPFIILGLWILSCLLMVFFYKIYGHPWTDLNGPEDMHVLSQIF